MKIYFIFFVSISVLFLVSCTTYSKKQCETMDWFEKGRDLAIKGRTFIQVQNYFAVECTKEHGVGTDQAQLQVGFDAGLKIFCSENYAFEFAKSGGQYQGTCPREEEVKILHPMQMGRIQYLEQRIQYLTGQISNLEQTVENLESQVSRLKRENSSLSDDVSRARSQVTNCP